MALNRADEQALKWAIEKYWREHTDEWIANGLDCPVEQVQEMLAKMGLERNKKGKESLKAFAQRYLMEMSEEDKMDFIKHLPAELIWKMAEGSPAASGTLDIGIEPIRIDITHQLARVYGPKHLTATTKPLGDGATIVPEYSEVGGEPG